MVSNRTDAEKGQLVLDAFRYFKLDRTEPATVGMLTAYFEENNLDLDDIESGLNYTRLQGWTENGPNQSTLLTEEGHAYLLA